MEAEQRLDETNLLLRKLLDHIEEQKKEHLRFQAEIEEMRSTSQATHKQYVRERLTELGASETEIEMSEEEWEAKLEEMKRRTRERADAQIANEEQFRRDLVDELRKQGQLLEQIYQCMSANRSQ